MLDLLAALFKEAIRLRNVSYNKRILESHDLGAFTVSVGNITTGGTGKTPLVAYIAELLADNGEKVCILTRGYGRRNAKDRVLVSDGESVLVDAEKGGDEPVELATKLLGKAIVIADADRVSAGEWAGRRFGATAFVLDDGFQHRKARRDLDIVCIDATQPLFDGKLLPAGRLREPVDSLDRADAIVITRSEQALDIDELRSQISSVTTIPSIFISRTTIKKIGHLNGQGEFEKNKRVFAFSALGNPDAFLEQLRYEDVDLVGHLAFRDHHRYSQADIIETEELARGSGAEMLVTTVKDAVKISDLRFEIPCFVAEIETTIDRDAEFRDLILDKRPR